MLKVGINGFGRIGRAVFRINMMKKNFEVVAINDANPSNENLAYMLKYDSTYGRLSQEISATDTDILVEGVGEIPIYHDQTIDLCPWDRHDVDIVIDSSGVYENLLQSDSLKQKGIKHQVITHAPEKIGKPIILEVNEHEFSKDEHFYVSSSICDANAFVPVMHLLENTYGVDHGFLTTLHPWLSYQNLLDGPCRSFAYPGHIHENFTLGRNSINALIPKKTSCVKASTLVLPFLKDKFQSLSYRVPTSIVSSADISVKLKKKTNKEDVIELFKKREREQAYSVFHNNFEPLISTDFVASEFTAIIDQRWTEVNDANYLKLILWYDNEWGYSSRIVDIIKYIEEQYE